MSVSVHGTITWIDPYRGGARPTPEMEAEGRRTKPCANQLFHVRLATAGDLDFDLSDPAFVELRTDADGSFAVVLEPGLHHVFRAAKLGRPAWHDEARAGPAFGGIGMDRTRNAAWRRRPDCFFEVGPDGEQRGVKLHWTNSAEAGMPLPC